MIISFKCKTVNLNKDVFRAMENHKIILQLAWTLLQLQWDFFLFKEAT